MQAAFAAVSGLVGDIGLGGVLGLAGTGLQTVQAIQQQRYQAGILQRQAEIEKQNALQTAQRARQQAQDLDLQSAAIMGEVIAQQAASGFALSSSSFRQRRDRNTQVANINRTRLVQDAGVEVQNAFARSAGAQASAANLRRTTFFTALSGGFNLGTSYLSSADAVRRRKLIKVQQQTGGLAFG